MQTKPRIKSIDLLRGVVMVIMALDHVRDYFHYDAFFFDPTDLSQASPAMFWTRFVTHFCAPVFIFLAGTSAFFVGQRLNKKLLSKWLVKRGLWLIFLEITVVKFAWMFKLDFTTTVFQVIWVLGAAMVFLAAFIWVPRKIMIPLSLLVIISHNLLDTISPTDSVQHGIWVFLHEFGMVDIGITNIFLGYPLIPWVFFMPLGYHFGAMYLPSYSQNLRLSNLWKFGLSCLAVFFILRGFNTYGDPSPWTYQSTTGLTISSYFNVNKYPPSLLYLCITMGPTFIFLAVAEKINTPISSKLITIGRVPMFFYIMHLYVIHLAASITAVLTGFSWNDMVIDVWVTMQPNLQGYGFNLWVVYLIWVLVVLFLYPFCKWYDNYKSNNRDKWWLSYL